MPIPLIIGAIVRFVLPTLAIWVASKFFDWTQKDDDTGVDEELKTLFASFPGNTPDEANTAVQKIKSLPEAEWMKDPNQLATLALLGTTAPKIVSAVNQSQSSEVRALFSKIQSLEAKLRGKTRTPLGGGALFGKFQFIMMLSLFAYNVPEFVFGWGSRQLNYLADLADLPKNFRIPVEPGQYAPPAFNQTTFTNVLDDLTRRRVESVIDPISGQILPFSAENLAAVMTAIHVQRSFNGQTTFQNDVLNSLQPYLTFARGAPGLAATELTGEFTPGRFAPTKAITKNAKPKLFVGPILAGLVGEPTLPVRDLEDRIDSPNELVTDAGIQLVEWLKRLPGRLSYKISVVLNPKDEYGVQKLGSWIEMSMFIEVQNKIPAFVDAILLGPIDPAVYYPETTVQERIQFEIPKELIAAKITPIASPGGIITTLDTSGNIVTVLKPQGVQADLAVAAPPPVAAPIPLATIQEQIAQVAAQIPALTAAVTQLPPVTSAPVTAQAEAAAGGLNRISPRTITVNVSKLFVRALPTRTAALYGKRELYYNNTFVAQGWVRGEDVDGENRWWVDQDSNYVWTGGTAEKP